MGIRVVPRPGESVQSAIKRLRKLCDREGVTKEMKRTEYYEKPSEKHRRKELKRKNQIRIFQQEVSAKKEMI
jgi:small subunit ribosomal protein S21